MRGYVRMDIDLEDVYMEMDDREKEMIIEWLKEDNFLPEKSPLVIAGFNNEYNGAKASRLELEFADKLLGLASRFHTMDNSEIEIIENLYKKYC